MAISELLGACLKSVRECESMLRVLDKCLASGEKQAWKAVAGVVGFAVRDIVPF
jgi:hypothetical protein